MAGVSDHTCLHEKEFGQLGADLTHIKENQARQDALLTRLESSLQSMRIEDHIFSQAVESQTKVLEILRTTLVEQKDAVHTRASKDDCKTHREEHDKRHERLETELKEMHEAHSAKKLFWRGAVIATGLITAVLAIIASFGKLIAWLQKIINN